MYYLFLLTWGKLYWPVTRILLWNLGSLSNFGKRLFISSFRWLFHQTTCIVYAFCGVLFGLCSLSNLTALSCVCWLKVCCPNYGKSANTNSMKGDLNFFLLIFSLKWKMKRMDFKREMHTVCPVSGGIVMQRKGTWFSCVQGHVMNNSLCKHGDLTSDELALHVNPSSWNVFQKQRKKKLLLSSLI